MVASLPFTLLTTHKAQFSAMVHNKLQFWAHNHHQMLLTQIVTLLSPETHGTILCGQATGVWLTIMPSLYHGNELSARIL